MKYKFYITHNSQPPVEVFPLKFTEGSIDYVKEEGQMFFRRKFSGSLKFVNNNGGADYTYFKGIEEGGNRCLEISLDIQRSCNDIDFESWWKGYFTVTDGSWNLDRCTVEFKDIKPDDEYRCLLEKSEEEVNILDASPVVETSTKIITDYEYFTCRDTNIVCSGSLPAGGGWLLFHTEQVDGNWTSIYYREKTITACLGGVAVDPPGFGWNQISEDCSTTGYATYVRTPVIVYDNNPNPNVAPGDCEDDGSGGFIESFPPRKKTLNVTRTNTPVTPIIIGYNEGIASVSGYNEEYTFTVRNNPGSTYTWSGTSISIISGQGTNTVTVKFTNTGTLTLQVVETTICSTASAVTKSIEVQSAGDLSPIVILQNPTGILNVCKNQESVKYTMPVLPELFDTDIIWSVSAGATIVSGQGTNEVIIDFGDGSSGDVTVSFSADNTVPVSSGNINGSVVVSISNAARTPDINGLNSVCPDSSGIVYDIQTRSGATYLWTVSGGTIVSGQGTGTLTVDWDNTTGSGSVVVKETINCGCNFIMVTECSGTGEPCFFWCPPDGTDIVYDQNRLLIDVLTLFSDKCGLEQVESDFFDMNAPGDTPGYSPGVNYVTGLASKVSNLMLAQKSDIIDPSASNPATRGIITFEEITQMLREIFEVYWFIDGDSLRFEHYSYFNRNANPDFDLTSTDLKKWIIGKNAYTYEKSKMPKFERYKWSEAQTTDFVGYEISYDSSCVNQDPKSNIVTHLPGNITTDLIYINSDPDQISKLGFVLIANDLVGSTYVVASEAGRISGLIKPNMHLSWANLHYNYHRHGRVLIQGNMNNQLTMFISTKRTKKQDKIPFPFCCDAELNPLTDLITTYLGNGEIDAMSLNLKTNMMTADLLHDL